MRCTKPWKGSIPSSDFTAVFCVVESFLFRSFPGGLKPRKSFKTTIKHTQNSQKLVQTCPTTMRKHPHNSSEPFWTVLNRSWGEVLVAKWNKVQPKVQPKVGTNPMSQNQKGESWLSLLGQISISALRSSQHVRCAQAPWPPLLAPANRPNPNDQCNSPSLSYIPHNQPMEEVTRSKGNFLPTLENDWKGANVEIITDSKSESL